MDRSGLSHPCFAHMNFLLSETSFVKKVPSVKLSLEVVEVSTLFLDFLRLTDGTEMGDLVNRCRSHIIQKA